MNILLEQINRSLLVIDLVGVQVADRDHADEAPLLGHHRQMANPAMLHDAARLLQVGVRPTTDEIARQDVRDEGDVGVALLRDDALQNVALREDADVTAFVQHEQRADLVIVHQNGRRGHGRLRRNGDEAHSLARQNFADARHGIAPVPKKEMESAYSIIVPARENRKKKTAKIGKRSEVDWQVTPTRLEHPPQNTGKTLISETGGAKSGALSANSDPIDPDLQRLIEAWPTLPAALKAGIVAMIDAARK